MTDQGGKLRAENLAPHGSNPLYGFVRSLLEGLNGPTSNVAKFWLKNYQLLKNEAYNIPITLKVRAVRKLIGSIIQT